MRRRSSRNRSPRSGGGATARPRPRDAAGWAEEIRDAYADARETLPFMPLAGVSPDEKDLFHLAPHVAIKFRGLPESRRRVAVQAALTSVVASVDEPEQAEDPFLLFAFSYLASHYGLELLSEPDIQAIMASLEKSERSRGRVGKHGDA